MDGHLSRAATFSVFPGGHLRKNATRAPGLAENENVRTQGIDLAAELLESLPDPVIGCAADGTVIYWNRAAEDVYGYPAGEALGPASERENGRPAPLCSPGPRHG